MRYTNEHSPVARLRQYIELVCARTMPVAQFCENYELVYGRELAHEDVPKEVEAALATLFESVARYSPLEGERKELHYLGDEEILLAAEAARARLGAAIEGSER